MTDSSPLNGWCQHGVPAGSCEQCATGKPRAYGEQQANTQRDSVAALIWAACREFDGNGTVNVNDYADQILRRVQSSGDQFVEAKMTRKKAQWWLESIVRNYGGQLHKEALAVIFAEPTERRKTVRRKPPVQQAKHKIIPKCRSCRGFVYEACTWNKVKCNQYRPV
jgi:hypothetical protein